MSSTSFNVLSTNAVDLQAQLVENKITSVQILREYFAQIDRHEPTLNALISSAPRENVIGIAASLDEERQQGRIRSPLHGIPIILKDCFITASDMGMSTTCGSLAFVGAKASKTSAIAQRLIDAGLIILAKGNMTEFAGMKMTYMMPGWSAHGGQTLSPYVKEIEKDERILGHSAPGGSSTGSAVAVAAGFSPLAMGTETIGSIITPSTRMGLYALKPTIGAQDTTGLYTMTDFYDSAGPMAKSAADVRAMTSILLDRNFDNKNMGSWEGLSVGFVDPKLWTLGDGMQKQHGDTAEQMANDFVSIVETLKKAGCSAKYPIEGPDSSGLPNTISIAHWEFKHICIPKFVKAFDECPVSTVEDIVAFNEANKDKAMPAPYGEQNDLITSMNSNESSEEVDKLKKELRDMAIRTMEQVFEDNDVNLIVGPVDSGFCVAVAAAGYPIATVPIGRLRYNGRPFGMCVAATKGNEEALLRFQAAYEASTPSRDVPDL